MSEQLSVWWISNPPREPYTVPVETPEEAVRLLNVLADYDLYLGDLVFANASGLFINEHCEEWEDELGQNIWEWGEEQKRDKVAT